MTLCTVPEASRRLGTAPIRADVRRNANALTTHENLPTTRTTELNNMTEPTLGNNVSIKRTNHNRTQNSQFRLNQLQQSNQHHTLRTTSTTNLNRTRLLQLLQPTTTTQDKLRAPDVALPPTSNNQPRVFLRHFSDTNRNTRRLNNDMFQK
jgi:hypothetical protein